MCWQLPVRGGCSACRSAHPREDLGGMDVRRRCDTEEIVRKQSMIRRQGANAREMLELMQVAMGS